jgi:hypothetical protein
MPILMTDKTHFALGKMSSDDYNHPRIKKRKDYVTGKSVERQAT